MIYTPHKAQTTSARSEKNRGNLCEVFVSKKCFRNTGCFRKYFRKIVCHSCFLTMVQIVQRIGYEATEIGYKSSTFGYELSEYKLALGTK